MKIIQWIQMLPQYDECTEMCLCDDGNVYVRGLSSTTNTWNPWCLHAEPPKEPKQPDDISF